MRRMHETCAITHKRIQTQRASYLVSSTHDSGNGDSVLIALQEARNLPIHAPRRPILVTLYRPFHILYPEKGPLRRADGIVCARKNEDAKAQIPLRQVGVCILDESQPVVPVEIIADCGRAIRPPRALLGVDRFLYILAVQVGCGKRVLARFILGGGPVAALRQNSLLRGREGGSSLPGTREAGSRVRAHRVVECVRIKALDEEPHLALQLHAPVPEKHLRIVALASAAAAPL